MHASVSSSRDSTPIRIDAGGSNAVHSDVDWNAKIAAQIAPTTSPEMAGRRGRQRWHRRRRGRAVVPHRCDREIVGPAQVDVERSFASFVLRHRSLRGQYRHPSAAP
jgi:hypothetical protein